MSPAPDYTRLGREFSERYSALQPPEQDAQYGYAYGHLAEAMMRPFRQLCELIDPEDPYEPWAPLFNLDIAPDWVLPWLGQVVGVKVPQTMSPEDQRNIIRALTFEQVGKPSSIEAVVKLFLSGTQTVFFRERDGSAYRLEITVLQSELIRPVEEIERALLPQIPAGIVWALKVVLGWDYQQMTVENGPYSNLPSLFADYTDLGNNTRT